MGEKRVRVVNCKTRKLKPMFVANFFKMFIEAVGKADGIWKLKVYLLPISFFSSD
jgi:hypothetical protein